MPKREKLQERRTRRGFTQESLAALLHVSPRTVRGWEAGTSVPYPEYRQPLADALHVTLDRLDQLLDEPQVADGPDLSFARTPATHAALDVGTVDALEGLNLRVPPRRRIGRIEVEQVRLMTGALAASENLYGGAMAGEAGIAHLRWACRMLEAQIDPAIKPALFEAVGNLAGVVAFSAFDVDAHAVAARCFRIALTCADQGGSWELRAATLTDMARQAVYLGDLDEALSLIEFAQVRADRLTATARAATSVVRARILALLGRLEEAMAEVDLGDAHFARRHAATDPPWLVYYDEAEHAGSSARALIPVAVAQGQPGEAAERLTMAISLHSDAYPRSRAFSTARLATLHMTAGDPREALVLGRHAAADAALLHSRRMNAELLMLMRASEQHLSIPDVADLAQSLGSAIGDD
ncbi:helix-turn-helix domain-containing protein [Saccharothrix sp. Mg75]|uniref:helix-turn-helix domain-containing protein n=1 Tax=Saccharothrix sp. Mg75 TaxID=3445357 RepID=UPI003EED6246